MSFRRCAPTHPLVSQACLLLLLPSTTRLEDLPAGVAASWLRTWSLVDDCVSSDIVWAAIFARMAHPARINSCRAAVTGAEGAPVSWPALLPLVFTRLLGALNLEVAGQRTRQVHDWGVCQARPALEIDTLEIPCQGPVAL